MKLFLLLILSTLPGCAVSRLAVVPSDRGYTVAVTFDTVSDNLTKEQNRE